jgi:hypothetical protein
MSHSNRLRPAMRARVAVPLLALLLAGCELFEPQRAPTNTAALPPAEAPSPFPLPPPRKPPPPGQALAKLTPPGPESPAAGNFDRLIGLDEPKVAEILGEPRSRAEAPPATIWRYVDQSCDLDVYFYLDLQSQAMRALHYEVRNHDSPERSAQRCYDAFISERRAHAEPAAGSDRPR